MCIRDRGNGIVTAFADGGGTILPLGMDITTVDDDRAPIFIDTTVGFSPAPTAADAGQPIIRPYIVSSREKIF